jgi:D-alanyl-D-alanine carboxypeptidase
MTQPRMFKAAIAIIAASALSINCSDKSTENNKASGASISYVDPKRIDDFVREEMSSQEIPGLSIAVVHSGKVIYRSNFGFANIEDSIVVKPESQFKIASLTKPITAIAIMQLAEKGKLSLDEKVSVYLDGLPTAWRSITIRQLLSHTSGLADYFQAPDWSWKNSWRIDLTHDEFIQMCSKSLMVFVPGEKMQYSNTGYYLLGMVIEKVSDISYAEYLSKNIFEPAAMSHSQIDNSKQIIHGRVNGYTIENGVLKNAEYTSDTWAFSEGGVITTVEDLAKLDSCLYSETLLKKSSIEQLWTPTKLSNGSDGIIGDNGAGKANHYGAGWFISDYKDHKVLLAGGNKPGFTCTFFRFPDEQLSIIILSNLSSASLYSFAGEIAEMYF